MIKKIILLLCTICFIVWGYFYIFPIYTDSNIPESFFYTTHHNISPKDEDKEYQTFVDTIIHIENKDELDVYFDILDTDKQPINITYLSDENSLKFLKKLQDINKKLIEWWEFNIIKHTKYLLGVLNNSDTNLVESAILIRMISENLEYLQLSNIKDELWIQPRKEIIENAMKHEYHYISSGIIETLRWNDSMRKKIFYDEKETRFLLKEQFYAAINNTDIPRFSLNGKNYIWRLLIDISVISADKYFEEEKKLNTLIETYNTSLQ